jgi:predicted  nucleic acid-binding Zn-ribbon protein
MIAEKDRQSVELTAVKTSLEARIVDLERDIATVTDERDSAGKTLDAARADLIAARQEIELARRDARAAAQTGAQPCHQCV